MTSLDRRDNFITCLLRWQPCFAAFQSNLKTKISNSADAVFYFAGMLINIFFSKCIFGLLNEDSQYTEKETL